MLPGHTAFLSYAGGATVRGVHRPQTTHCLMWRNSPATFATSRESTTWWQRRCLGLQRPHQCSRYRRFPLHCPYPSQLSESLVAAQASCTEVAALSRSKSLDVRQVDWGSSLILCDVSSGVKQPLVPNALRRQVFDSVHSLAHPGVCATRRLISSRYI